MEFGPRGSALWEFLGQSSEFSPAGVLAVEACRLADRLDWLADDPSMVQEARLSAAALKTLLESPMLRQQSEAKGASPIDALAARRADRRSAAQGS